MTLLRYHIAPYIYKHDDTVLFSRLEEVKNLRGRFKREQPLLKQLCQLVEDSPKLYFDCEHT